MNPNDLAERLRVMDERLWFALVLQAILLPRGCSEQQSGLDEAHGGWIAPANERAALATPGPVKPITPWPPTYLASDTV
jgi:hypothetical protein